MAGKSIVINNKTSIVYSQLDLIQDKKNYLDKHKKETCQLSQYYPGNWEQIMINDYDKIF